VQHFHPSGDAGIDFDKVFFIDHHLANGPDGPLKVPSLRKRIPDTHVLGNDRVDAHGILR